MAIARSSLSFGAFLALFIGGAVSWMARDGLIQWVGYVVALTALLVLFGIWPLLDKRRIGWVALFCGAAALLTVISMGVSLLTISGGSPDLREFVQSLAYPFIAGGLLLQGWRVAYSRPLFLARALATIGILNFGVALLASLGVMSSLPVIGDIPKGRHVFGTDLPSSGGLFWNVNYYATAQATVFLLYYWLLQLGRRRTRWPQWAVGIILLGSTLLGSSRGVTVGLLVALWLVLVLALYDLPQARRLFSGTLLLLGIGGLALMASKELEWIYQTFRLYKGLNLRDVIWSAAFDIWSERPLLGYGFVDLPREYLESRIGVSKALQSAYLSTLLRGGVFLFVVTYGLVLICIAYGAKTSRRFWVQYRWPLAIVVFWLLNATVRTFSLGGLGLLPIAAAVALSAMLYSRWYDTRMSSS